MGNCVTTTLLPNFSNTGLFLLKFIFQLFFNTKFISMYLEKAFYKFCFFFIFKQFPHLGNKIRNLGKKQESLKKHAQKLHWFG